MEIQKSIEHGVQEDSSPGVCDDGSYFQRGESNGGSDICKHPLEDFIGKECGGDGIYEQGNSIATYRRRNKKGTCKHGTRRDACVSCKGSNICQHQKQEHTCRQCGGAGICEHGRIRRQCVPCGGKSICEHDRIRNMCKRCAGGGICLHGRQRHHCVECNGTSICPHEKRFSRCYQCGGSELSSRKKDKKRKLDVEHESIFTPLISQSHHFAAGSLPDTLFPQPLPMEQSEAVAWHPLVNDQPSAAAIRDILSLSVFMPPLILEQMTSHHLGRVSLLDVLFTQPLPMEQNETVSWRWDEYNP